MGIDPNPAQSSQTNNAELSSVGSTRREFLSKNAQRAAYIAPVIWSISARQALAGSEDSSAFGSQGGGGPPAPE